MIQYLLRMRPLLLPPRSKLRICDKFIRFTRIKPENQVYKQNSSLLLFCCPSLPHPLQKALPLQYGRDNVMYSGHPTYFFFFSETRGRLNFPASAMVRWGRSDGCYLQAWSLRKPPLNSYMDHLLPLQAGWLQSIQWRTPRHNEMRSHQTERGLVP